MTRALVIITRNEIKRFVLGKSIRPMTIVRNRLYRTDERYMMADCQRPDAMAFYRIDSTQPMGRFDYIDPDETMAYIDVAKTNSKTKDSMISKISNIDGMKWIYIAVAAIIVLSAVGLI